MNSVLQIAQQIQHLRLNRDIQRRDRLVGDDELRVERERAGDADALALATAELVRIAVDHIRVQADDLEQLADTIPRSAWVSRPKLSSGSATTRPTV